MVWRAPLVRAPDDEAMASLLTELRRLERGSGRPGGRSRTTAAPPTASGCASSARSARCRAAARGQRGEATTTEDAVADALGQLGDRELLAYANLTGRLWAVVARGGRTSLHDLGDVAALDEHLEVRRVRPAPAEPRPGVRRLPRRGRRLLLEEAATSLADLLLPATVARSDRPLVVVPTGALHGVPWRALAPLRGRPVSVSPSLSAWSTASQAAAGRGRAAGAARPAAFVAGPALRFADAEIAALAPVVRAGGRGLVRRVDGRGRRRPVRHGASSSTSPATARSAPTTRCSRRSRSATGR